MVYPSCLELNLSTVCRSAFVEDLLTIGCIERHYCLYMMSTEQVIPLMIGVHR